MNKEYLQDYIIKQVNCEEYFPVQYLRFPICINKSVILMCAQDYIILEKRTHAYFYFDYHIGIWKVFQERVRQERRRGF